MDTSKTNHNMIKSFKKPHFLFLFLCVTCLLLTACAQTMHESTMIKLENTRWKLTQWKNSSQLKYPLSELDAPITVQFDQTNRVSGFSGCNRFFAHYVLKNDRLTFSQIGLTRHACMEAAMHIEMQFIESLEKTVTVQLLDSSQNQPQQLILTTQNGEMLYFTIMPTSSEK